MKQMLLFAVIFFSAAFVYGERGDEFSVKADSLRNILSGSYTGAPVKCAFALVNEVKAEAELRGQRVEGIEKIQARPAADTSIVSPAGYFRIHYNKSGFDAPGYSVMEAARAADSSYRYEVDYLGFAAPPGDNGAGGDTLYDIYILNLGGVYGFTELEDEISPGAGRYYSYIYIDNDFGGFYTTGIEAARVTMAHEIHHAIQIGGYIIRKEGINFKDVYFYELCATAMEEFVFDTVNDYYGYQRSFFTGGDKPLPLQGGYNSAHWNIYLIEKFKDISILRHQWELMKLYRPLEAIQYSLTARGSSLAAAWQNFAEWCYFSGYRYKPGYFEEGMHYPSVEPLVSSSMLFSSLTLQLSLRPMSLNYLRVINENNLLNDTLFVIYTNSDIERGTDSLGSRAELNFQLSNYETVSSQKITDNYYLQTGVLQPLLWGYSSVLNEFLIPSGGINFTLPEKPYPSPFKYGLHHYLVIPLENQRVSGLLEFAVYSASMDLIYQDIVQTGYEGKYVVKWKDVKKQNGERLASGVYIYILKAGSFVQKGKFSVVHE